MLCICWLYVVVNIRKIHGTHSLKISAAGLLDLPFYLWRWRKCGQCMVWTKLKFIRVSMVENRKAPSNFSEFLVSHVEVIFPAVQ